MREFVVTTEDEGDGRDDAVLPPMARSADKTPGEGCLVSSRDMPRFAGARVRFSGRMITGFDVVLAPAISGRSISILRLDGNSGRDGDVGCRESDSVVLRPV